ncbi:MAG: HAD family phosphatase [Myxococcales bacterium]|nr:HAD family phosphatase [Myxococcales bacterium]
MNRHFDAVLFDFGGVFTPSPFLAIEAAGTELGARPGQLLEIIFGSYHEDNDHPWHRLERGEIDLGSAREEIMAIAVHEGFDVDPLQLLLRSSSSGGGGVREAVVERTRRLRDDGYRTALVTNNAREFRAGWSSLLATDELFDAVIDSSEVGMRKPDPRIYTYSLAQIGGVVPERAIFLDDFEGNIDAAVKLGMTGILVGPDPQPALAVLDEALSS